jgi:RNA polymerase sigma factor (sigma-70 family)
MHDATDMDLLRQYAEGTSDAAFAALVSRHVNLVYSVALRKTGNPHVAEEITQAVFIILAQKAGRIPVQTILPGWLYQAARLTAASFLKREIRRVRREQEAYMRSQLDPPQPDLSRRSGTEADETWEQLAPLLDDAMGQLSDKDRAAVVLRFFGGKSFAEVATVAGVSENAAKKRVSYALEKLHRYFSKRGVSSTSATIAGAISAHSVQAAPVALAKAVTAIAIAKGAAASTSTLILIQGALKIMAWTKAKTAVVAGVAILLTVGTTTIVVKSINAIQRANPPDLQGAWEGVEEIRGVSGVLAGEYARSRVVFKFFKTNGIYRATGEFIDTAPEPFQATRFTYEYPSVRLEVGQNLSFQGKLKAQTTQILGTCRTSDFSAPMVLKRTSTPDIAPEPLAEGDYRSRAGSDLQGCWKATFGSGAQAIHITVKISEPASGMFRAELDNVTTSWTGQPLSVTYDQPEVKLLVASGAGMFQGRVRNHHSEMAGDWIQGGRRTPVIFQRTSP